MCKELLISAIEKCSFESGELALHALSGKIELQVRDKVFFNLVSDSPELEIQKEYAAPIVGSARGCAVDLVIEDCAIEFKAYISADTCRQFMINKIINSVADDFEKMYSTNTFSVHLGVLIVSIPRTPVPNKYKHRVRYSQVPSSMEQVESEVKSMFKKVTYCKKISAGVALGTEVDVGIFLIED